MKKFFITATAIFIAVLSIPAVMAFAADTALEDIPMLDEYYFGSKKAYIYYSDDDNKTLTYFSSEKEKILYKSKKDFRYKASISEDGRTVFFSVNDTVYKYSARSGKIEKIYTVKVKCYPEQNHVTLYSSPNGEYCLISWTYYPTEKNVDSESYVTLWHDGKEITEKKYFSEIFGVTDSGEALAESGSALYSLSFDSGKLKAVIEAPEDEYFYDFEVYPDTGAYIMYSDEYRSVPDFSVDGDETAKAVTEEKYYKFYFGKIGETQHELSPDGLLKKYFIAGSGESIAVYDGGYVVRINLESGKRKRIAKLPEKNLNSNYITFSADFDAVLYLNRSKNKLVRLSGWDVKKNSYTKREEIELNGTGKEYIKNYSDDLKTVLLSGAEYSEESNSHKDCAAFFESGKLVPIDKNYRETRIDRFGNFIGIESVFYEQYNIDVITPDGGKKTAFSKCDEYYRDQRSGFFIFCTETATDAGEYYENGFCTDYYINKNGEAVLLWDSRNTYEIEYLD